MRTPYGAVAWSPAKGFVFDPIERDALVDQGAVVLDVDEGVVTDIHGDAPLVVVLRLEYEIVDLRSRLAAIVDHAYDVLAAR